MPAVSLTTNRIAELKPRPKPYDVPDTEVRGLLVRVHPSGSKVFYWRYRRRSDRRQQMVRIEVQQLHAARNVALVMAGEKASGGDPVARVHAERAAAIQSERQRKSGTEQAQERQFGAFLLGTYATHAEAEQKRGSETVARMKAVFSAFLDLDVAAIDEQLVMDWRAERIRAGIARTTVDREAGMLRTVLARAVKVKLLAINPLAELKPLVKASAKLNHVRYLSDEEEIRLRGAFRARDAAIRAKRERMNTWLAARNQRPLPPVPAHFADHIEPMVLILLGTGMRFGELVRLRWSVVDFRARSLTVRGDTAKSGTTRYVPLATEVVSILSRWRTQVGGGPHDLVFPGKSSRPIVDIKTAWARVLRASGVDRFRIHDLRHTFASKLVQRGVGLYAVQQLLGHASPLMTQRYSHLAPGHLADAVAVLDDGQSQPLAEVATG